MPHQHLTCMSKIVAFKIIHTWRWEDKTGDFATPRPPLVFPPDLPFQVWTWSRGTTTLAQRSTSPQQKVTLDRHAYFPEIAPGVLFKREILLCVVSQAMLKLSSFWLTCVKWIPTWKTGTETSHSQQRRLGTENAAVSQHCARYCPSGGATHP